MKKTFKSLLSCLVCTSLVFTQTASVYTTTAYAAEDFTDMFTGLDSVVNQLLDFGLDINEVETLLSLTPKDPSFYSRRTAGTSVIMPQNLITKVCLQKKIITYASITIFVIWQIHIFICQTINDTFYESR